MSGKDKRKKKKEENYRMKVKRRYLENSGKKERRVLKKSKMTPKKKMNRPSKIMLNQNLSKVRCNMTQPLFWGIDISEYKYIHLFPTRVRKTIRGLKKIMTLKSSVSW